MNAKYNLRDIMSTRVLAALLLLPCVAPMAGAATNSVSKPAGFVHLELVGTNSILVSTPFDLFDSSIQGTFGDQLTGGAAEQSSDVIRKWDAATQAYTNAFKHTSGTWFNDYTSWSTSQLTFVPGEGFWLEGRQNSTQDVFLSGSLVVNATMTNALPAGISLFAYPFSSALLFNDSQFANSGATAGDNPTDSDTIDAWLGGLGYENSFLHNNSGNSAFHWKWCYLAGGLPVVASNGFELGRGYWYHNRDSNALVWTESRPYSNPFPANDDPPRIAAMEVGGSSSEMTLSITAAGTAGEMLDIFYKDFDETNSITATGWFIADMDLPTSGSNAMQWTDSGSPQRPAISDVFGRCYLVGRADLDQDADGLPNGREQFVYGTLVADSDTDNDNLTDGVEVGTYGTDPLAADSDSDGMGDGMEISRGHSPLSGDSYTALPFVESFESLTNGAINGQNGWTASPVSYAKVTTNGVCLGSKSLIIEPSPMSAMAENLIGSSGATSVWSSVYLRLTPNYLRAPTVGGDAATAFYLNSNGYLVVYDGTVTNWVTLTNHSAIGTSSWVRIVINQDFVNKKWALQLNGTQIAADLGFANDVGEFSVVRFLGAKYGITMIDQLIIAAPGDHDQDGMSDVWELLQELDPTVNDASGDMDDDGLTNLQEYQNGTNPWNDDTDNDGVTDGDEVAQGRDPLTSGAVADGTGLLVGLKVFTVMED